MMLENPPLESGFLMPAEWEEHEGTWLQWPHDDTHENVQMRMEYLWLAMASALHQHETVHITVPDERRLEHLENQVSYYGFNDNKLDLHIIPTNDVWSRDNGPIFLVNEQGDIAVSSWNFNGWGERYPYDKDRQTAKSVAETLSIPLFNAPITLEGGAIEVNGQGTLIATRSSIINANRNPGINQEEIEAAIKGYLGVKHIIWLSGAPREFCDAVGDETDFHIDTYARFVDESTVLYSWTDDTSNPLYPYLNQHLNELREAVTESGEQLNLVALPIPENATYSTLIRGVRPPFEPVRSLAVYANFYIANGVVLVPVYGDINDIRAMGIIAEHFPDREVIPLPAQMTAELGGMMHCITQQQPAAINTNNQDKS
jgi:agmatine deiminase